MHNTHKHMRHHYSSVHTCMCMIRASCLCLCYVCARIAINLLDTCVCCVHGSYILVLVQLCALNVYLYVCMIRASFVWTYSYKPSVYLCMCVWFVRPVRACSYKPFNLFPRSAAPSPVDLRRWSYLYTSGIYINMHTQMYIVPTSCCEGGVV